MKRIIAGIVAALLMCSVAFAETDKTQWENLQRLKPGQKIQVVDSTAISKQGRFKEVSQDQIVIELKNQTVAIPRIDVSRVVLKKSKTPFILMGLAVGAGIGLSMLSGAGSDETAYYEALVALPFLAGGGAGVGALLPTGSVVYQRSFSK
jgi:hypothetical protein